MAEFFIALTLFVLFSTWEYWGAGHPWLLGAILQAIAVVWMSSTESGKRFKALLKVNNQAIPKAVFMVFLAFPLAALVFFVGQVLWTLWVNR